MASVIDSSAAASLSSGHSTFGTFSFGGVPPFDALAAEGEALPGTVIGDTAAEGEALAGTEIGDTADATK